MEALTEFIAKFGTLLRSSAVLAIALIGMGILQRILQRSSGAAPGRHFRNQLILFSASVAVVLLVILGLPLDQATRGQLLSLFGIVVSATIALSSSTILGNAVAGIMLKTVRNFRSGDFVQVGDHFGRISERGLFHTEIQTPDRDLTTLPNLYLTTTPVTVIRASGTVVSASCSLGYDTHHTRIEELLLKAAEDSGLSDPFVQVLELGDFSVTYKVAGLLTEVKSLLAARSRLRVAMLDAMHEGGVEIVSPDFRNIRTYGTDRTFIPAHSAAPSEPARDAAPVEVVFDKAEVAQTHQTLRAQRAKLEKELKAAEEAAKSTDSEKTAARAGRRAELLKARLARLEETIAQYQDEMEEERDD